MSIFNKNKKTGEDVLSRESLENLAAEKPVAAEVVTEKELPVNSENIEQIQTEEKKVLEAVKEEVATSKSSKSQGDDKTTTEKTEEQIAIENIMSDGIAELYNELPENRRAEFKQKGELTAGKIELILNSAKVKFGKIVGLLKKWLSMLPGVNKYFLEQESKIKADQIVDLKNRN
jgi:hypothetical protein